VSSWGWITTCYLIVFGAMGAYTARVMMRARELAKRVPDEDKPWL
jgi:hypothetical protein